MLDGSFEDFGVGAETLKHGEFVGHAEDGDAGARLLVLHEVQKLIANVDLVRHGRVEGVEKQDVEGGVLREPGWKSLNECPPESEVAAAVSRASGRRQSARRTS